MSDWDAAVLAGSITFEWFLLVEGGCALARWLARELRGKDGDE